MRILISHLINQHRISDRVSYSKKITYIGYMKPLRDRKISNFFGIACTFIMFYFIFHIRLLCCSFEETNQFLFCRKIEMDIQSLFLDQIQSLPPPPPLLQLSFSLTTSQRLSNGFNESCWGMELYLGLIAEKHPQLCGYLHIAPQTLKTCNQYLNYNKFDNMQPTIQIKVKVNGHVTCMLPSEGKKTDFPFSY